MEPNKTPLGFSERYSRSFKGSADGQVTRPVSVEQWGKEWNYTYRNRNGDVYPLRYSNSARLTLPSRGWPIRRTTSAKKHDGLSSGSTQVRATDPTFQSQDLPALSTDGGGVADDMLRIAKKRRRETQVDRHRLKSDKVRFDAARKARIESTERGHKEKYCRLQKELSVAWRRCLQGNGDNLDTWSSLAPRVQSYRDEVKAAARDGCIGRELASELDRAYAKLIHSLSEDPVSLPFCGLTM